MQNYSPKYLNDGNPKLTEEELRKTWKIKPKISKKFPSAFSSMQKL